MNEHIHIALGANRNYINGLLVTLISIIRSASDKSILNLAMSGEWPLSFIAENLANGYRFRSRLPRSPLLPLKSPPFVPTGIGNPAPPNSPNGWTDIR